MGTEDKKEQDRVKNAQIMRNAVEESAANWPLRLQLFGLIAQERKAQYDAYIKAGFDATQALKLVCAEVTRPS